MLDTRDWLLIILGLGIGIFIGFLFWHPNNNDYVDRSEYNELYNKYQDLLIEQEELKKDMGKLILEYYGRSLVLDSLGLKKYRTLVCLLQEHLIGDIPLIKEIC